MLLRAKFAFLSFFFVLNLAHAEHDFVSNSIDRFPKIERKSGKLSLVIEAYTSKNGKYSSQLAERAEVWLNDRRLASMHRLSKEVVTEKDKRIFPFPTISLPPGYYFLTVRLYKLGWISGRKKWNGETFQVGIHSGKVSRIYKKIPIVLW